MPMYKKRRTTKPYKRKRRYGSMVPRNLLNGEKAHRHIVTCSSSTQVPIFINCPTSGVALFAISPFGTPSSPNLSINFSLADVVMSLGGIPALTIPNPSIAELQQLYDTFQIEKVEITVFSGNTESTVTGEALTGYNYVLPLIGHTPDTDDAGNTSLTQLQQYSTYKCEQLGVAPLRMTVVPCIAGQTFGTGYVRAQKQDVNVSYAATPHYGYKMAVDGFKSNPNTNNCILSFQFRIHYLMKTTR